MQKYINLYDTETEYGSDATNRPSTSSVSYVIGSNTVHYDGTNIITNASPKIGDAVYGDATNHKVVFIDGASLKVNNSGLPEGSSGLTKIGQVVGRFGRKVLIHWWEDPGKQFAKVWQWVVAMTDGVYAGKVLTIKHWDPSSGTSGAMVEVGTYTVPSNVTTMEAFASGLDTWLRAHNPVIGTGSGATAYNWHCEVGSDYQGNDAVLVTCDNNSPYQRYNTPISGDSVTCTLSMCNYLPAFDSFVRKNGSSQYDAVINADRFIINNSSSEHIKNRSGFDADTALVNKYGSGDAGFRAYIEDMMVRIPCSTGGVAVTYGKSRDWSKWMAGRTYTTFGGGAVQPQFTAANWCDTVGVSGVPQLTPGSFYMAGVEEAFAFLGRMKYSSTASERDIVDLTRAKMGTTDSLLANNRWLCARRAAYYAWHYHSSGYSYGSYSFYGASRVSAVALFDLDS